jgi:hypothetical protein
MSFAEWSEKFNVAYFECGYIFGVFTEISHRNGFAEMYDLTDYRVGGCAGGAYWLIRK